MAGRKGIRVVIDEPELRRQMAANHGAQATLRVTAVNYMAVAREASPVGLSMHWGPFVGTHGYFKRRFHVRPFRGGFRVYNKDQFAHLVEYGSSRNRAYAPFRRALRSYGARSTLTPKGQTVPFERAARP